MIESVNEQIKNLPNLQPDVILVDGNGILHPDRFGSACHVGVALNIPTIGVAKNMHFFDETSETKNMEEIVNRCNKTTVVGAPSLLKQDGDILGCILLTSKKHTGQPVFVSQGHKICLDTAVAIVKESMKYDHRRLPEPIFQADYLSRFFVARMDSDYINRSKFIINLVNCNELIDSERRTKIDSFNRTNGRRYKEIFDNRSFDKWQNRDYDYGKLQGRSKYIKNLKNLEKNKNNEAKPGSTEWAKAKSHSMEFTKAKSDPCGWTVVEKNGKRRK